PTGRVPLPPPAVWVHTMKDSRASSLPLCGTALWLLFCSLSVSAAEPVPNGELRLEPKSLTLTHLRQPHSILVGGTNSEGLPLDLTGATTFNSADPKIASVDSFGWVHPVASGKTSITIKVGSKNATVPVTVALKPAAPVSFRHEVMPVFS